LERNRTCACFLLFPSLTASCFAATAAMAEDDGGRGLADAGGGD